MALGVVLAVAAIGGIELTLRHSGLDAVTVFDSPERWIQQRERASRLGDQGIVLLGASRMQAGIDTLTLRKTVGLEPVQLAISANPVLPVLSDLAADRRVTGTVIVSLTVDDLYENTRDSQAQQWVLLHSERRSAATRVAYEPVEQTLRRGSDSILLSRASGFHPLQLFRTATLKSYTRMLPDRSQKIDYTRVDRSAVYAERVEKYIPAGGPAFEQLPDFDERVLSLKQWVDEITGRGGNVVLVRFPSAGRIWEADEVMYPKTVYWDRLAELVDTTTVHFADYPVLGDFDLPDGVHLDQRETARFTEALASVIF